MLQWDADTFTILLFVSYSSLAYSPRLQFTSFLFNFVTVWFVHSKVPNSAVSTCVTNTQIKLENIFVTTAVPGQYPSLSPLKDYYDFHLLPKGSACLWTS